MTTLLDGNVLIALSLPDHTHHETARRWLFKHRGNIASCPITQGALLRVAIQGGVSTTRAGEMLAAIVADPRHEFWPDDLGYADISLESVLGHRQVTDAYLAQLARKNGGQLITFDRGLAAMHDDVADLVSVDRA
ncbi:MAG: TA system VapC family ribonuclease toxin [Mycobacteriales bacterium]